MTDDPLMEYDNGFELSNIKAQLDLWDKDEKDEDWLMCSICVDMDDLESYHKKKASENSCAVIHFDEPSEKFYDARFEDKSDFIDHLSKEHPEDLKKIREIYLSDKDQDQSEDQPQDDQSDEPDSFEDVMDDQLTQLKELDCMDPSIVDELRDFADDLLEDEHGLDKVPWIVGFTHGAKALAILSELSDAKKSKEEQHGPDQLEINDSMEKRDLNSDPHHRTARATILVIELFSQQKALYEDELDFHATKKKQITSYLDHKMENPPSSSTITRILQELEQLGYIERKYENTDRWHPTAVSKQLNHLEIN